jgi:hypothetical protein
LARDGLMKATKSGEFSWGAIVPFAAVLTMILACPGSMAEDWQSYKPAHSLGSGSNDWWTAYPDQSEMHGSAVEHPQWILDSLGEKPVIVFLHQDDCKGCAAQLTNINAVMEMYPQSVILFDIMADWKDSRFVDFNSAYHPQFVPTTVFLTRAIGTEGKTVTVWHSVEDAMSQDQILSFVKDAIYYYQENASQTS